MNKKLKITLIVIGIILAAILLFNPFSLWIISALFEEGIDDTAEFTGENDCRSAAQIYLKEKYNGRYTFFPSDSEQDFDYDGLHHSGYIKYLNHDGHVIYVLKEGNAITCYDNYQYEEIVQAIKEHYFTAPELGEIENIILAFYDAGSGERISCSNCVNDYFDGSIEELISGCEHPKIYFTAVYNGSEKDAELYEERIYDKFIELNTAFYKSEGFIYVKDPDFDSSKITDGGDYPKVFQLTDDYYGPGKGHTSPMPMGAEYLSLYAGVTNDDEYKRFDDDHFFSMPVKFRELDEFTSAAYNVNVSLTPDSIGDRTVLSEKNHMYKPRPKETPLKINDVIYRVDFSSTGGNYAFLRLDKSHYGITDDTVPLAILKPSSGKYVNEIHYTEMKNYWYDDKYMYIAVSYLNDYIGFTDKNDLKGTENELQD